MDKYYYLGPEGRQMGPYSFSELRSRITPETIVWREGMDDWAPASTVPELDELFRSSTPPRVGIHAASRKETRQLARVVDIEHIVLLPSVWSRSHCLFGASRFAMVRGRTRTCHQLRQKGEKLHNSKCDMLRCRLDCLLHPILAIGMTAGVVGI